MVLHVRVMKLLVWLHSQCGQGTYSLSSQWIVLAVIVGHQYCLLGPGLISKHATHCRLSFFSTPGIYFFDADSKFMHLFGLLMFYYFLNFLCPYICVFMYYIGSLWLYALESEWGVFKYHINTLGDLVPLHTHSRFTVLLDFVQNYPGELAPER